MGFDGDDEMSHIAPNDGTDNGTTVESDHAIVLNTTPSAPTVVVTSTTNPPMEAIDDLTCTITNGSTDADGDSIDYTYTWYDPNGVNSQGVANTNALSDTFPGSGTTPGLWECEVIVSDGSDTNSSAADVEVDSDWAGILKFNNCGQSGHTGPSQSQCDSAYSGTTLDGFVTVSSGFQYWTVPESGLTRSQQAVSGGYTPNASGGQGRVITIEVNLTAGDNIAVTVGQEGGRAEFFNWISWWWWWWNIHREPNYR